MSFPIAPFTCVVTLVAGGLHWERPLRSLRPGSPRLRPVPFPFVGAARLGFTIINRSPEYRSMLSPVNPPTELPNPTVVLGPLTHAPSWTSRQGLGHQSACCWTGPQDSGPDSEPEGIIDSAAESHPPPHSPHSHPLDPDESRTWFGSSSFRQC